MQPFLVNQNRRISDNPIRELVHSYGSRTGALFLAHIPLALLMLNYPFIAIFHALFTLAVGIITASSTRRLERTVYVAAYITGAEVLWRMTQQWLFWEYGKYAVTAVFFVSILRMLRRKEQLLPFLYFLLLIPSTALILGHNLDALRQDISFNLSGPFSLMISCLFFSRVNLTKENIRRTLIALVMPITGIAAIVIYKILTAQVILFQSSSMMETSGGFGPNQVSAILGLAALSIYLIYLLCGKFNLRQRVLMIAGIIYFASQSALTFSRTGVAIASASALLAFLFLIRNTQTRLKIILTVAIFAFIANYYIFPRLQLFTGGAILMRFTDTSSTGRADIFKADLEIWKNHLIFGVGPGQARFHRSKYYKKKAAAHTEFSRLVAEHGVYGFVAFLLLLTMGFNYLRNANSLKSKGLIASLTGWSYLFLLGSAMRLVAPSFLFGLASARIFIEDNE